MTWFGVLELMVFGFIHFYISSLAAGDMAKHLRVGHTETGFSWYVTYFATSQALQLWIHVILSPWSLDLSKSVVSFQAPRQNVLSIICDEIEELVFDSDSEEQFTTDDSENECTNDISEGIDHSIPEN